MAKVLTSKQAIFHETCVDTRAREEMVEVSVGNFDDDDVCNECGNSIKQEPEPSEEEEEEEEG